jgi:putative transposase
MDDIKIDQMIEKSWTDVARIYESGIATKNATFQMEAPDIHHRHSIRLKGYDYARAGLYFITICVKNRECLFGKIENAQMFLNDVGQMIEKWYRKLENKFPDKKYRQMVIMPNHFHCIIENTISETPVGTDRRVCPGILPGNRQLSGKYKISGNHILLVEHAGSPLHRAVQWFKTITTNAFIRGVRTKKWATITELIFPLINQLHKR